MAVQSTLVPVYTSKGDVGAYLIYPYIYDRIGEWIGWVTSERQVYSVYGNYVGWLTADPRILRKLSTEPLSRQNPPPAPRHLLVPATVPLAPMMAELTFGIIDVLDEAPDLMPSIAFGEQREDLD